VGRELGVRYILDGSVRKAAKRVRITTHLVDALIGAHLWADRFDGAIEDIFDLQDQVTANVVGAIAPKLEQEEINRASRKPTGNLQAYDFYLRAIAGVHEGTKKGFDEALRLSLKAIELDQRFAAPYGMAAYCSALRKARGWMNDRTQEIAAAERLARQASKLGKDDAETLSRSALAFAHLVGDFAAATACIDRALELNPNSASTWIVSGWLGVWLGDPDRAINHVTRAMRLSPLDPQLARAQAINASAHFVAGRYGEAASWAEKSLQSDPNFGASTRIAAAAYALSGRMEDARKAIKRVLQVDPALRISNLKDRAPWQRPMDIARLAEALQKAGLPE
jgi:adenylate cyclase